MTRPVLRAGPLSGLHSADARGGAILDALLTKGCAPCGADVDCPRRQGRR